MKTRKILPILALPALIASCTTLSNDQIGAHNWYHGGGYSIGNRINFDDKIYSMRQDTICRKEMPVAVVVYTSGDLIGNNNDITIQSLATGEEGKYHQQ